MRKRLAIIGNGRMGKVAARFLKGKFDVGVHDKIRPGRIQNQIRFVSPVELAGYDVILFALPVSGLEDALRKLSGHIKEGALVIDLSAVKEQTIGWMKKLLPRSVRIVGMHPLFGPDSLQKGFAGKEIIVSPARINKNDLAKIVRFLNSWGFRVTRLSPSRHDRLIASTLLLTQFIGRSLEPFTVDEALPRTQNYRLMERIIRSANNDKFELFLDIYRYNRYAKPIPAKIIKSMQKIEKILLTERKIVHDGGNHA